MNLHLVEPELDPIEIDPRPCGLCGLKIDRHERVDASEGPEFFCIDLPADDELDQACEREIMLAAAELVRQWELADRRDRWRHTGEQPPRAVSTVPAAAQPYRTPQSTIDAFWYVVGLCNPERLKAWLGDHPQDASFLLKLLEGK
jgi:hypothetical protein